MSDEMRVTKITIRDVKRIHEGEMEFPLPAPGKGKLYEFLAGNDNGKTTWQEAITSIWDGGKDHDLIRRNTPPLPDAKEAICIIELSNGVQLIRRHTEDESSADVINANGVKVNAPVTFLKKLSRGYAFDPLKFDEADSKKQLEYLLEISTISFTPAEIKASLGEASALVNVDEFLLDKKVDSANLAVFGKLVKLAEDTRAATGRRRDEKTHAIEALRKTLLASDAGSEPQDWGSKLKALQARKDTLERELREETARINGAAKIEREKSQASKTPETMQSIGAELEAEAHVVRDLINQLPLPRRREAANAIHRQLLEWITADEQKRSQSIDKAEQAAISEVTQKTATEREQLTGEIEAAQVSSQAQAATQANRDLKKQYDGEVLQLNAQYDALVAGVKNLDGLRKSKLETGFVRGLEVREDGRIYVDGIYWRDQNQATRFIKSIEVCAQGVGDVGFMACDGGERLDANSKEVFRKAVEKSGLQVALFSVKSPEQLTATGPALESVPAGIVKMQLAPKRRSRAV